MFYDIHAHLNHIDFADDLADILDKMKTEKVIANCVGYDLQSSMGATMIAESSENVFAVVGVHPDEFLCYDEFELKNLARGEKVVGIGECGFDFFRVVRGDVFDLQDRVFRSQIEIALGAGLPLMLHVRPTGGTMDAYEDALRVLDDYSGEEDLRVNFHFFAGDMDIAKEIISRGFSVSFTGVVTFSEDYNDVVKIIPDDKIMVETDSPWVAPAPFRGKRCTPLMVKETVDKIAEIRGEESAIMRKKILDNSMRFFMNGKSGFYEER